MAYVPGQKSDVFISYSHNDSDWLSSFKVGLKQRVEDKLGATIDVWKDTEDLQMGHAWSSKIEEAIRGTAAFLAILSPSYGASKYCAKERKTFIDQFEPMSAMKVGDMFRFLKVVKTAWENNAHQHLLPELQHFEFFRPGAKSGDEEFIPGTQDYSQKVSDCARAVASLLKQMRRKCEYVFIAPPAEECSEYSEDLKKELEAHGYDAGPHVVLDYTFDDKIVKDYISPACLTVHLLGATYDRFVERQIHLAAELDKPMLIWLTKAVAATQDSRQRKLIEGIREGQGLPKSFTLLDGVMPHVMIEEVKARLRPVKKTEPDTATSGKARVYLLCDPTTPEDALFAANLQGQIQGKEGLEVQVPQAGLPTPSESIERDKKMMLDCDGVLLYQGLAPTQWLMQTTPSVLFAELQLHRPPMKSKAFLLNDPTVMPGLSNVIWRSPEFKLGDLEPFLAPLRLVERASVPN